MEEFIHKLAQDPAETAGLLMGFMALGGGLLIGLVAVIGGLRHARETERTRREIAAYVAEGTMTAEDAALILKTKPGTKCG
ncbi:MAG: hypothetical protein KDA20_05535 [Phycisphaerales bacterium]|nr:hypothetical protein [Phycisphaerales bacterium]